MISRCCNTEVYVENSEESYFVCEKCYKACELREKKNAE